LNKIIHFCWWHRFRCICRFCYYS